MGKLYKKFIQKKRTNIGKIFGFFAIVFGTVFSINSSKALEWECGSKYDYNTCRYSVSLYEDLGGENWKYTTGWLTNASYRLGVWSEEHIGGFGPEYPGFYLAGNNLKGIIKGWSGQIFPLSMFIGLSDNYIDRIMSGAIRTNGHGVKLYPNKRYLTVDENAIRGNVGSILMSAPALTVKESAFSGTTTNSVILQSDNIFLSTGFLNGLAITGYRLSGSTITQDDWYRSLLNIGSIPNILSFLQNISIPKVDALILDGNNIPTIKKGDLTGNLVPNAILSLEGVGLKEIEPGSFDGVSMAHLLDLSNNQLDSYSGGLFSGLNVDILNLSHQYPKDISSETFSGATLSFLNLSSWGLEKQCSDLGYYPNGTACILETETTTLPKDVFTYVTWRQFSENKKIFNVSDENVFRQKTDQSYYVYEEPQYTVFYGSNGGISINNTNFVLTQEDESWIKKLPSDFELILNNINQDFSVFYETPNNINIENAGCMSTDVDFSRLSNVNINSNTAINIETGVNGGYSVKNFNGYGRLYSYGTYNMRMGDSRSFCLLAGENSISNAISSFLNQRGVGGDLNLALSPSCTSSGCKVINLKSNDMDHLSGSAYFINNNRLNIEGCVGTIEQGVWSFLGRLKNGYNIDYLYFCDGNRVSKVQHGQTNIDSTPTVNPNPNPNPSVEPATISYSTTVTTTNSVIATLNLPAGGTVTNNGGSTVYTFRENGSFTFQYKDKNGLVGTKTATVTWIKGTDPIVNPNQGGLITYSPTIITTGAVIATLNLPVGGVVTNNGGMKTYTFRENGSFTFQYRDAYGNVATATATVTWIKASVSVVEPATIIYSTTATTNNPVVAVLLPPNGGVVTNNGGSQMYTFTKNGTFTFQYRDKNGVNGTMIATVTWIVGSPTQSGQQISGGRIPILPTLPKNATERQNNFVHEWAYKNGLTMRPSVEQAGFFGHVKRAEMAKMMSVYIDKFTNKVPDTSRECVFVDSYETSEELAGYMKRICQLGLMGRASDGSQLMYFWPNNVMTRAELMTVISRMLYGNTYDSYTGDWWKNHMNKLYEEKLLSDIRYPMMPETKGTIMQILYRLSTRK